MSVAAGSSQSALLLESAFDVNGGNDPVSNLDVHVDPERVHRYNVIGKFLRANDGRNPKVPDLDKIVPLPPAKLPAWDGTFQWQKNQDAATPPPKPSGELINELAKAKHRDPRRDYRFPAARHRTADYLIDPGVHMNSPTRPVSLPGAAALVAALIITLLFLSGLYVQLTRFSLDTRMLALQLASFIQNLFRTGLVYLIVRWHGEHRDQLAFRRPARCSRAMRYACWSGRSHRYSSSRWCC